MFSFQKKFPFLLIAVAALAAISLAGCDSKSPTAPERPDPGAAAPVTTTVWNITVTASPSRFELPEGGTVSVDSTITVTARSASTNQPPPDGSTAIVSTSVGSGVVTLQNGTGSAVLSFVATALGSVEVQASLEGSVGRTTIDIVTQAADPTPIPLFIERVSPDRGSPVGGERVRIIGTGFEEPIRVTFGSLPAVVRSVTSTLLVVETPTIDLQVGSTSTVNVTVNINVNEAETNSDTLNNAFTYTRGGSGGGGNNGGGGNALVPRIVSVSPTSGPNEGGTQVTINGEGFSDQVQVFFGTTTLIEAPVLSVSESRLVVTTPSATGFNDVHQNALVDVLVRNTDSGFEDTLTGAFQYGGGEMFISGVSPDRGPYTGGENVTIFGQNFEGPAFVRFNGVNQNVLSVSGTEILVVTKPVQITSCADVTVGIDVINIETNEMASLDSAYTFVALDPSLNRGSFTPTSATINVSTRTVTPSTFSVTASDVEDDFTVLFTTEVEARQSADAALSGSTITGTIPPMFGTLPVEPCDDNGDGFVGERYLPFFAEVTITNTATGCTDTLVDVFTYNPSDTSCRNDIAPPPDLNVTFSASPNPAALNGNPSVLVVFTNTTTGCSGVGISCTYTWDFGDGGTSTTQNTSHAYGPPAQSYTVTLSVLRSDGISGTAQVTVQIDP